MAMEEEKAGSLILDVLLVAHPRKNSAVKGQDPGQLLPPLLPPSPLDQSAHRKPPVIVAT